MDKIVLRGLHCFGYHGVFPEENRLGQKFVVHLQLYTDLGKAGTSDNVLDTIDYGEAATLVREIVEGDPVALIEALAERIGQKLLMVFEKLQGVQIEIEKPNAPIRGVVFESVSVVIERWR